MRTSVDLPDPDSPTMPRLPPSLERQVDAAERACARARGRTATCAAAGSAGGSRRREQRLGHVGTSSIRAVDRSIGASAHDVRRAASSSSAVYSCWAGARVAGRAALDDAAVAHHDDVVDHVGHEGDVVADEHQRRAVLGDELASRAMISACTVTSRAVVGSSAISSAGRQASAMAIPTRWRCPPESWCG